MYRNGSTWSRGVRGWSRPKGCGGSVTICPIGSSYGGNSIVGCPDGSAPRAEWPCGAAEPAYAGWDNSSLAYRTSLIRP